MVFKGRFFSSKKSSGTSSPEGSNSPRSIGSNSNSPIRSEKKKPKSATKEDHHRPIGGSSSFRQTQVKDGSTSTSNLKHQNQTRKDVTVVTESKIHAQTQIPLSTRPSSGAASTSSKSTRESAAEVPPTVSPILASSLGLNRIKTRSGPLPRESFLGFNRDSNNNNANSKMSSLGASNLSKAKNSAGGDEGSFKKMGIAADKKKIPSSFENVDRGSWADNVSASDATTKSLLSRDQTPNVLGRSPLRNVESSSEAGTISITSHDVFPFYV